MNAIRSLRSRCLLFLLIAALPSLRSQVSLEKKIAQMVMVGFSGASVPESIKIDLTQRGLGGVILFAANITGPQQVKSLNDSLRKFASPLLLVAVDQEGGKVARLGAANGFTPTPTAYTLGTTINREDSTRAAASLMAGWLKQSGFNVDFAPVADVNVNPKSPAIGAKERSYSRNPDTVALHTGWFIEEFHKKKIVTTLKHFPGHGSAASDSHLGFTDVTATWSEKELIPFRSAINRGLADLIMTGHLYNATIDSQYPASLSRKTVQHLLRDSLGFSGVVISDELFMNAIAANYPFDDALELCVKSGTDILLFGKSIYNNRSLTAHVVASLAQKVRSGIIDESLIDSAYNRIQRLKQNIVTSTPFASLPVPSTLHLEQNYPNPFNPATTITFTVAASERISLRVYDILGRSVATLVDEHLAPGSYTVRFDGSSLSAGLYFSTLRSSGTRETRKMLLVK